MIGFFLIYFIEEFVHFVCDSDLHVNDQDHAVEQQVDAKRRRRSVGIHRYQTRIDKRECFYPRHDSIYSLNEMFYCTLGPLVYIRYLVIILIPKLEKVVLPFRTILLE